MMIQIYQIWKGNLYQYYIAIKVKFTSYLFEPSGLTKASQHNSVSRTPSPEMCMSPQGVGTSLDGSWNLTMINREIWTLIILLVICMYRSGLSLSWVVDEHQRCFGFRIFEYWIRKWKTGMEEWSMIEGKMEIICEWLESFDSSLACPSLQLLLVVSLARCLNLRWQGRALVWQKAWLHTFFKFRV